MQSLEKLCCTDRIEPNANIATTFSRSYVSCNMFPPVTRLIRPYLHDFSSTDLSLPGIFIFIRQP